MKIAYNGEVDKRTNSNVLAEVIPQMAAKDPAVFYLDADCQRCVSMYPWAKDHQDHSVDCGIAEANMIGVAAGMSAVGFKPFCHAFACFASRRCFDQVFLSGGYAKNPITVIGSDPGVCAAFNGGTHMPFEDIALYRTIPEGTVIEITDAAMLDNLLWKVKDMPGVKYLRIQRKNSLKVYEDGTDFTIGKASIIKDGKDVVIFATGIMVAKAIEAANELAKEGIDAAVIDMFSIKPLDEETVVEYAKKTGAVVTAENHNKIGGLYSAISDVLISKYPIHVEHVAVEDTFGEVGPQPYLEETFGLTVANIVAKAKAAVAAK